MSDDGLKYGSYREYKEHEAGEHIRFSLKVAALSGVFTGILMSTSQEDIYTQMGITAVIPVFAFIVTWVLSIGG